jgi:RHS repeat-associated protein
MNTCRYRLKPGQVVVGDPVDVVTGASLDTQTDFVLAGPLPLRWYRNYDSSKNTMPGSLGWGQFHEYDRKLVFDLDGMRYVGPTGDSIGFPYLEYDGQTVTAGGVIARRVTKRQYTILTSGEPLATYDVSGDRAVAPISMLGQGAARITFQYDSDGRLTTVIDSKGRPIRVEHDGYGRLARLTLIDGPRPRPLAEYLYDSAGNLIRMTDPFRHTHQSRFDADNRQVARIDRRGYGFRFEYDSLGRCTRAGGQDGTDEVRLKYNPDLRMTVVTKKDGGDWTYFYDESGSVTRILAPDGGISQFNRDETGRMAEEVDPLGNLTRRVFNAAGVPVGKIDPLGQYRTKDDDTTGLPPHRVPANPAEWDYGDRLKWQWITLPAPGQASGVDPAAVPFLQTRTGPAARPTREEDDFGNLFRETFPDGTHRRWVYDANGNITQYTDREGRRSTFEYMSWNMLAAETDPMGGRVRYRYAPHRHITACIDAGNTLSEYGYDANERLCEVRRHGIVKETYQHDVAGNLIEKRDADGKEMLSFEIGPRNLPVVRRLASGDVHTFKYDDRGRRLSAKGNVGETAFAYDEGGRRVQDERDGQGVRHTFSLFGLNESKILGQFVVKYERPVSDEVVITDPTGATHTVRVAGRGLTERRFANGTTEVSQYGENGRCLARVRTGRGGVWARTFRYSPEGDLLAATDSLRGETTYRYDAAHRLIGVQRPDGPNEPIELDLAGNILRMPGLTGVRMLDGNRLSAANGERFEFNRRNHIAVRTAGTRETRYHYDSRDMLVKVERDGEPDWTAGYDPLGRRAWKAWGNGKRVEYFWDTDRLIAERDETGRTRVYVYADPFAMVPLLFVEYATADADPADGKRYYVFTDQIGTPTRVEDDRGEVVWSARIDPYGRADIASGSVIDFAFRFPGHWFDPETGLHYNRFRYYDPVLGRYLQSDPIGLAGGLNLYGYCGGNPLVRVDVRGLSGSGSDCGGAADPPPPGDPPDAETPPTPPAGGGMETTAFPGLARGNGNTNEHAQRVSDAVQTVLGRDASVTVIEHADGTVSVGISGSDHHSDPRSAQAQRVVDYLNENYPPPEGASRAYFTTRDGVNATELQQGPPTPNPNNPDRLRDPPPPGNCSEPHAAQAANSHDSPPTGYQTVWSTSEDAPTPNRYPNGDPPRTTGVGSNPAPEMCPCGTCRTNQHQHLD